MNSSEINDAEEWLEAIGNGEAIPNLVDAAIDGGYKRASFYEYRGEYHVFYEEGVYTGIPTRLLIGSLAVHEVEGLSNDERSDILLDSATSPAKDHKEAKRGLTAFMGLNVIEFSPRTVIKTDEFAEKERALGRISNATLLDREDARALGLEHFRAQPFKDPKTKQIYLISREPLKPQGSTNTQRFWNDEYPALRYSNETESWELRMLEQHEWLSISNFSNLADNEYKADLLRERNWHHVNENDIVNLTSRLGNNKKLKSHRS